MICGWKCVLKRKKEYRRGYPVAVLIGIKEDYAVLWKLFSRVVKHEKNVPLRGDRSDLKALYNFHESMVDALRPSLREGVRSFIVASPARTSYAHEFVEHIKAHHMWLVQGPSKAVFSEVAGSAATLADVAALTRTADFRRAMKETTAEETEDLIDLLEKRLSARSSVPLVLYGLEEIENAVLGSWKPGIPKPEYLLLTDEHLSGPRQRNRLQRLMQIAANRGVKTRVVTADSVAGKRLAQLGGMVCIMKLG
jgi:stalled ribosome rescue protein Dom34